MTDKENELSSQNQLPKPNSNDFFHIINLPAEISLHIVNYLTSDPASIIRLMWSCKKLYLDYANADANDDDQWKIAVDNIWKSAANKFCWLSLTNGPFEPSIGSGLLYIWFVTLVTLGERNVTVMRMYLRKLNETIAKMGGAIEICHTSNDLGLDIMREIVERGGSVPQDCFPSYRITLIPGMIINLLDPYDVCQMYYVQNIDQNVGFIELRNPFFFDDAKFLTRGELNVINCIRPKDTELYSAFSIKQRLADAFWKVCDSSPINLECLMENDTPYVDYPSYQLFGRHVLEEEDELNEIIMDGMEWNGWNGNGMDEE
jgi:hypothetical protein